MRSIAFADFLIGLGILFVLEGLMFAASPAWMRRAMKSALETPENILRLVGIGSAVAGLILIWLVRRETQRRWSRPGWRGPWKIGWHQRHREWRVPAFRRIQTGLLQWNVRANACAAALFGRTVDFKSRDDFS